MTDFTEHLNDQISAVNDVYATALQTGKELGARESAAKVKALAAMVNALVATLEDAKEFAEDYVDVRDGEDGQPMPRSRRVLSLANARTSLVR